MIYWILALVGATAAVAASGTPLNELEALGRAQAAVAKHHWSNHPPACLDYIATSKAWTFEVYEKHDAVCGGDPDTAPHVMTLHVDRSSGEVTKAREAWEK